MKVRLAAIIGLSFLWSLLYSSIYFPLSYMYEGSGSFSQFNLSYFHAIFCIVLVCLLVAGFFIRYLVQRLVQHHMKALAIVSSLVGFIGALILVTGPADEGVGALEIGAATALLAIWFVLVLLGWITALANENESTMAKDVCLSFIVHLIVFSIVLFAGIPLVGYLLICPPCASLALLFAPRSTTRLRFGGVQAFKELPLNILIPLAFFIFLGVVSTRLMVGSTNGVLTDNSRFITIASSLVIMSVMAIWCFLKPWSSDTEFSLFSFLAVAAVFGFVAIILLDQYDLPYSTKRIAVASEHCQELFCFMVLVAASSRKRLSPLIAVIAFVVMCFLVPRFVANDLIFLLESGLMFDASGSMAALAAGVIFLFTVLIVVLLMHYGKQFRKIDDNDGNMLLLDSCSRVARVGGLSKREMETLVLLCEGTSVKGAADALYVAESTVKTHVKHIYEKLDVHSRHELSELVDKYGCDGEA